MKYVSPLRYPGGKGCLASLLADIIELNGLRGCVYYEPYAGGAGAALELLRNDVVSKICINDADVRIHAFWRTALMDSVRFADEILKVPLNISEWRRQREICVNPRRYGRFRLGFAAFYMNRCNRSGVLTGAGPIGGYKQQGQWKLSARFNRMALVERILALEHMRDRIFISNEDALVFLKGMLPHGRARKNVFVYLDPPYVNKGQRLYLNSYEARDHVQLARYMKEQAVLPWLMSYDDTALVRGLYADCQVGMVSVRYSLQDKRNAGELLIAPHHVAMLSSRVTRVPEMAETY